MRVTTHIAVASIAATRYLYRAAKIFVLRCIAIMILYNTHSFTGVSMRFVLLHTMPWARDLPLRDFLEPVTSRARLVRVQAQFMLLLGCVTLVLGVGLGARALVGARTTLKQFTYQSPH